MVKLYENKIAQKGSLLIEAMAMLGLIAMVTPMLYKKAAERTTELQDINAAGQVRIVMDAVDSYLYDNYNTIVGLGDGSKKVTSNCSGSSSVTYNFDGNGNISVPLAHFCEYLPYGFNVKSKTFSSMQVIVKKRDFAADNRHDLTALLVTTPGETKEMPMMRASRIASMVGTNAGIVRSGKAQGVQGVWEIPLNDFKTTGFTPANVKDNTLVATSIKAISAGTNGAENVLHRVRVEEEPWLNTMETTLHMGDHAIDDVKQMIVTGQDLANKDQAILLKNGMGLTIEGAGNANIGGNATIGKKMTSATANVTGLLEAGTANIRGQLTAASAVITGNIKAGSATITGNASIGGNATITGTLGVTGDTTLKKTTINGPLIANDTTSLRKKVIIGNDPTPVDNSVILDVNGDARFRKDVKVDGFIDVDSLDVNRHFRAGYIRTDGANKVYNLDVTKDYVDILVNNFQVGAPGTTGGMAVTNALIKLKANEIELSSPRITLGNEADTLIVSDSVSVNQKDFMVNKDAEANPLFKVERANSQVKVLGDADFIASSTAQGNVFAIDTNHAAGTKPNASIYVRKGVIEMDTNTDTTKANPTGYIKLDRILSGNKTVESDAYNVQQGNYGTLYDEYQVNPAYTSVMHDIKLTTRGGARLSDILPDFINKGIYVLDGTYKEKSKGGKSVNWSISDSGTPDDSANFPFNVNDIVNGNSVETAIRNGKVNSCPNKEFECPTTPWLGFIPAPTCPPGYLKVATINPIRWAMSQAGRPYKNRRADAAAKEVELGYNRDPNYLKEMLDASGTNTDGWKNALFFQQNTWLNTSLVALKKGGYSYGWSGVIGFIYPSKDYRDYIQDIGGAGFTFASDEIAWNLFEVFNQQVVGVANVYCYFNRRKQKASGEAVATTTDGFRNDTLVDRYDQMTKVRVKYTDKDSAYKTRLNDPKLKYTDPW